MAGKSARRPRMAAHHDTTFRPVMTGIGNDAWQHQADAAAWSAVSGMPAALYLGAIEPIPIPPDLRQQLREAGKALADQPSAARADALLRLAHRAAYGVDDTTPPLAAPEKPADASPGGEWWDTATSDLKAASDALSRFAEEAHAALGNVRDDPANEGEAAFGEPGPLVREWWE